MYSGYLMSHLYREEDKNTHGTFFRPLKRICNLFFSGGQMHVHVALLLSMHFTEYVDNSSPPG